MTMRNYKVVQEDGTETFYQFDDATPEGKQGLAALQRASKNPDNTTKSVDAGDPKPINAGSAK